MTLFPNPTTDQLNVALDLEQAGDALMILFNMDGKVLNVKELDNVQEATVKYDISNYAPGTYMMRVVTTEGTSTKKFVVAK